MGNQSFESYNAPDAEGIFPIVPLYYSWYIDRQWRTGGGWAFQTPPPRNSEVPPKSCQTQPNLWKLLKIAEFRMPTPQYIRKKGSKILKLPRFAIVLH